MEWASRNDWFEKDPEMTGYAYGLHEKLVKSGIDPRTEEYYNELDAAVRRVFPDKFGDEIIEESAPQRQAGNVVAPAARSGKKTTQSATDLNAGFSRQETWSVK